MPFFKKPEKEVAHPLTVEDARQIFGLQILDIGKVPLLKNISAEDVKISIEEIRAIRNEAIKRKLDLAIIGYLCWVSTQIIINQISANIKRTNVFVEVDKLIGEPLREKTPISADIINMLRLFHSDPRHFLYAFHPQEPKDQKNLFLLMCDYWYDIAYNGN
jgi:hypothetical protein